MTERNGWTPEEENQISTVINGLWAALQVNEVDMSVAASALMVLSATISINSLQTDEYLMEQYRLCLLDARTRQQMGEKH